MTSIMLYDRFTLDVAKKLTADGYLPVKAKVARTGIQIYSGKEVERPELDSVRVYRPEAEVFKEDSIATYAHRPVTLDHPPVMVNSQNWNKYARGMVDGKVLRDGDFVEVPMLLMDQAIIDAVQKNGVKENSMGYLCELDWTAGVIPEGQKGAGEKYDALQTNIRINHLAIVRDARGGPELRIADTEHKEPPMATKSFMVDRVTVTADEIHAQIIERALSDRDTKLADQQKVLDKLTADLSASTAKAATDAAEAQKKIDSATGENAVLKKQVEDAKITPAMLDARVKDRAIITAKAQKVLGAKFAAVKDKDDKDIKIAVVASKLGDAWVTGKSDDSLNAAFDTIMADVKSDGVDVLNGALGNHMQHSVQDSNDPRELAFRQLEQHDANAWQTVPPASPTKQ